MKSLNQFADEIDEQGLQEKTQQTGRGPERVRKIRGEFSARKSRTLPVFYPSCRYKYDPSKKNAHKKNHNPGIYPQLWPVT